MTDHSAILLLSKAITPNIEGVLRAIHSLFPKLKAESVLPVENDHAQSNGWFIRVETQLVGVVSIPMQVPPDPVLVVESTQKWKDAKAVFEKHTAHLVITTVGPTGPALPTAQLLTAVIGAFLTAVPECTAVIWNGEVMLPAAAWRKASVSALEPLPNCPFPLWVTWKPFRSSETVGLITGGLSSFCGREFEVETTVKDWDALRNKLMNLIMYLLSRGAAIPDGDTIGPDEQQRFTVHHKVSDRVPGVPVMYLMLPV